MAIHIGYRQTGAVYTHRSGLLDERSSRPDADQIQDLNQF